MNLTWEGERGDVECGGPFGILAPRWQTTSALEACAVHLGPRMDPLNSLGTKIYILGFGAQTDTAVHVW